MVKQTHLDLVPHITYIPPTLLDFGIVKSKHPSIRGLHYPVEN